MNPSLAGSVPALTRLQLASALLVGLPSWAEQALADWSEAMATDGFSIMAALTVDADLSELTWTAAAAPDEIATASRRWLHAFEYDDAADDLLEAARTAGATLARTWVTIRPDGLDTGWLIEADEPLLEVLGEAAVSDRVLAWAAANGVKQTSASGWSLAGRPVAFVEIPLPDASTEDQLHAYLELAHEVGVPTPPHEAVSRLAHHDAGDLVATIRCTPTGVSRLGVRSGTVDARLLIGLLDAVGRDEHDEVLAKMAGLLGAEVPAAVDLHQVDSGLDITFLAADSP